MRRREDITDASVTTLAGAVSIITKSNSFLTALIISAIFWWKAIGFCLSEALESEITKILYLSMYLIDDSSVALPLYNAQKTAFS